MRLRRNGFTFIEILIVMIIIGVVAAFGVPRLRNSLQKQNVRSARAATSTLVSKARAAAVQRGCRTTLQVRTDGRVWVTACRTTGAGGLDTLGGIEPLGGRYSVTVTPSRDSVQFDPRGLLVGGLTLTVRFTSSGATDSIFVNQVGKVVR